MWLTRAGPLQRTTAGMLGQLPPDFKLRVECEREALHKLLHSAVRARAAAQDARPTRKPKTRVSVAFAPPPRRLTRRRRC